MLCLEHYINATYLKELNNIFSTQKLLYFSDVCGRTESLEIVLLIWMKQDQ